MIAGIDPGLKGAIAWVDGRDLALIKDIPTAPKRFGRGNQIDPHGVALLFNHYPPDLVVLEGVWPRPGESTTSSSTSGIGYGVLQGVLAALAIPFWSVAPATWKAHYSLRGKPKGTSITIAQNLCPGFQVYKGAKNAHDRAEALLLALYGGEK